MRSIPAALTIVFLAASVFAMDADSLLVRSVGGKPAIAALRTATSYRTEGSANLNGLMGEYTQVFAAPDKFYIEIRIGGMNLVQAYDGHTAWKRDHNGRISRIEGMEKRQLMTQVYLASYSFVLPDRLPGSAAVLGDTTVNDTVFHQVALYPLNEDTLTMLLDPVTAEPRFMVDQMDNLTGVTLAGDYRIVDGVMIAFQARTEFQEVPLFTEMVTRSMEFGVEVDPALFSMPIPADAQADFRIDGADSVRIYFRYHGGHIWIPATVNGAVTAWFILDSGASANMFNKAAVSPLGLSTTGSLPAVGLGGIDEIPLVRTDSVSIGSLTLLNQIGGLIDLEAIGVEPPSGITMGGLLGHDFLSRFPVLINYQESTLTVYNPATFIPPPGGTEIPFHLTLLVPTIRAAVNGLDGDFIIDLGNAVGLVLHHNFYQAYGLDTVLAEVREMNRSLTGVGGGARTVAGIVPRFQMGNILMEDVPAIIPETTGGLAGSEELAGNIGNLVLNQFVVLLDYTGSRVFFYPPESGKEPPLGR